MSETASPLGQLLDGVEVLDSLPGDLPWCRRVSAAALDDVEARAAELGFAIVRAYDQMQDDMWLRVSHNDKHILLKASP